MSSGSKGGANRALVIGIGGGSGSGKTTLARRIQEELGADQVGLIELDAFYRDFSELPLRERERINFDDPNAIDWDDLLEALRDLRAGEPVELPIYNFSDHCRSDEVVQQPPVPVIVVEGIHGLSHAGLRELLDICIYVDTEPDIRFIRRLRRDILDRDRSIDSVVAQYLETVRPMFVEHVEPSRRHADVIVPEGGSDNELGMDLLVEALLVRIRRSLGVELDAA